MKKQIILWTGPLAGLAVGLFTDLSPGNPQVSWMAGITVWMAWWWMTEVVNLAVTSLIPFVMLPLLGIADARTVAFQYMDQVIFLFIGGFLLAFAIERHGLHQRFALGILSKVGRNPATILAGVMAVSFMLSMWISNTATVMMLLSAVLGIIHQTAARTEADGARRIASALLTGLAYSATIGGMATLVGTPPNMVFYRVFTETYPEHKGMDFLQWFRVGFPVALVFLLVAYFIIRKTILGSQSGVRFDRRHFSGQLRGLGKQNRDHASFCWSLPLRCCSGSPGQISAWERLYCRAGPLFSGSLLSFRTALWLCF